MTAIKKFYWAVMNGFGEWFTTSSGEKPAFPKVYGPFDTEGEARQEIKKRSK